MSDLEIQQRLMRPFVKRVMATADGAADGTTIVALQVPQVGEFGLGEGDGFWDDAEVFTLTGDMKDQLRRVTGWVQGMGTLTVDHAFINPNVSLLSGNVVPGAVIIPVVDGSVFSTGEARIWDALNAETVTIITVGATQLTLAAILTNGYTMAAGAAISMSPRILGPVVGPPAALGTMFLLMTPMKTTGALGSRVQLTDWVDDGEVYPDGSIPVAPAKVTLAAFDDLANVAAVGAAGNLALNTDHRGQGANSTEWDKLGTGILGGVAYTPPAALDLGIYSTHAKIMAFLYIPTPVGDIEHLYIALGTDAANLFYWEIPLADIVYDAFHHYHLIMSEVDDVLGVGADLSTIQHVGVYVQTALAADTLTGILLDDVVVKRVFDQMLNQEKGKPLITRDTGENTNPERWLHDNHWNTPADIPIIAIDAGGEQALGAAVGAGVVRRIREVTARHMGTVNTIISILDETGGNVIISFDVPPQTTRTWSSQDGRAVAATLQPVVQTSDVTTAGAIVSAAGVEV